MGREDNVIARIIAGITIPASELGVAPMPGEQRAEAAAAPTPEPAVTTAPVQIARATPIVPRPATSTPQPAARARTPAPEADKPKPDAKAADPKAKPAAASAAKAKPDPAKAEPARHWVQVAGGANVGALPKEWAKLLQKAPAELRARTPWTTPLRFTNRLLVGPFKTPAEAQAFVNAIGKQGISAFAWSSEAGQKIEKLALK